jgi:hypothetical protein
VRGSGGKLISSSSKLGKDSGSGSGIIGCARGVSSSLIGIDVARGSLLSGVSNLGSSGL